MFLMEGVETLIGPRFLKLIRSNLALRSLCAVLLLTLLLPPNGMDGDQNFQGADHPNLFSLDAFDTSPEFVSAFERSREPAEKIASYDPPVSIVPSCDQSDRVPTLIAAASAHSRQCHLLQTLFFSLARRPLS
jgi:hypothetical protein